MSQAFLIPNNLASRSGVRASVRDIAALLRDTLDERVTVIGDLNDELVPLWIIHPEAGVGVVHIIDGGRKTIRKRADALLGRAASTADVLRLAAEQGADVQARLGTSKHIERDLTISTVLALPDVSVANLRKFPKPPGGRGETLADHALGHDDLTPGGIEAGLRRVFGLDGQRPLTAREEKVVRAAITPEIIIRDRLDDDDDTHRIAFRAPESEAGEDPLAVLDRQQQQLAMHLGDGYRVIRGVAGSGKSIVLSHRARHLATEDPSRRILLTTYNVVIAQALALELADVPNVEVRNIDKVAWDVLGKANLRKPTGEGSFERARLMAAAALNNGSGHLRYDAVLVDEAQDFDHPMLDLAEAALKGDDLVIALDGAQNIRRTTGGWSPKGQDARGRTTVLRRNYRNTREILELAYGLLELGGAAAAKQNIQTDGHAIVEPESAARRGPAPVVRSVGSLDAEIEATLDKVEAWHKSGVPWSDMLLLFGSKAYKNKLYYRCLDRGIPYHCIVHDRESKRTAVTAGNKVRSSTIQTIKGVEFGHVAIMGVNSIWAGPESDDTEDAKRRLLYVGMTRATDELMLTVSGTGEIGSDLLALAG